MFGMASLDVMIGIINLIFALACSTHIPINSRIATVCTE